MSLVLGLALIWVGAFHYNKVIISSELLDRMALVVTCLAAAYLITLGLTAC